MVRRAAAWTGWPLSSQQVDLLRRFGTWLRNEAIEGGGLGPNEAERIEERHLADSLLFAIGWPPPAPPACVIDLGSGVGLPGVPLAILWPTAKVNLVERGERRAALARRGIRTLGIQNVTVTEGDAAHLEGQADLVVARAVAEPEVVGEWAHSVLGRKGRWVIGGSHHTAPRPSAGEQILAVPPEILDHPVWLRMMAPT